MKAFIARDKDGGLYIYLGCKPYKSKYSWNLYSHEHDYFKKIPDKDLFPEVKWEDEEPTEVSIEIVSKKAQQPQEQRQQQTKFDPKTLKPFDKVLIRDNRETTWEPDFFGYMMDGNSAICVVAAGNIECVPYNEETKHLVGTAQDAPQYYRYWED